MNPEDELCDKLTARIETAVAMGKSAREMAHSIMPIVLAYETRARADERAKVAEKVLLVSEVAMGYRCPACHGKPAVDRWKQRMTKPQYACGCGHQWDLPSRSGEYRLGFDWSPGALLRKIVESGELPEIPARGEQS